MDTKEYAGERDEEAFWRAVKPRREPMQRRWYLPALLVGLAISVPWYWESGAQASLLLGLPVWVWVTLVSSFAISGLTAYVAVRHWDDQDDQDDEPRGDGAER
jgi:hypothetical protein